MIYMDYHTVDISKDVVYYQNLKYIDQRISCIHPSIKKNDFRQEEIVHFPDVNKIYNTVRGNNKWNKK